MATHIHDLVDDCLLHIFDILKLDPLGYVPIAQVCIRWERVVRRKFNKITVVNLCDRQFHNGSGLMSTDVATVQKAMKYIGPQVKSMTLGDCLVPLLYFNHQYCYRLPEEFGTGKLLSTFTQTCKNIEQLLLESSFIVDGRLDCYKDYKLRFPNLKQLKLKYDQHLKMTLVPFVRSVLSNFKHLKALNLVARQRDYSKQEVQLLSIISAHTQLEDLQLTMVPGKGEAMKLETDLANKLMESCQNLRILKLDKIDLDKVDVSTFLKLPNLEQLYVSNARLFSSKSLNKIGTKQFEKLTKLHIEFKQNVVLDSSGLCDAIERMPALQSLTVREMPRDQTAEITCRVIASRFTDTDIILEMFSHVKNKVHISKSGDSQHREEPLKMGIHPQESEYVTKVEALIEKLENCSVSYSKGISEGELGISKAEPDDVCCCFERYFGDVSDDDDDDDVDSDDVYNHNCHNDVCAVM